MSEYIKKEDVQNIIFAEDIDSQYPRMDISARVHDLPCADVVERKYGKWIRPTRVPDSMLDECSVCGFDTGAFTFNYCPSCGADMRGE